METRVGLHPRSYLSYSQLSTWEKSPELYRQKYLEGKQIPITRAIALGKEVAESMETGEETGDPVKDLVIAQLPKYEIRDQKMLTILRQDGMVIPILIKCDSIRMDKSAFYEIKTGVTPWDQKKVDEDGQLDFYSTGIYLITRKIPACELAWAPCDIEMGENGFTRPYLTGAVRRFPSTRDYRRILKTMQRMSKAWREIGEMVDNQFL